MNMWSIIDYNMKTYKELYYINNTPWKSKLNLDNLKRFESINYNDIIIFHFDFVYSVFKVVSQQKPEKTIFISAINCCLRLAEVIKKLYPYNKIYIIIHTKEKEILKINIDYNTFKSVIDIIPNIAIVSEKTDIKNFDIYNSQNYKHIFYGNLFKIERILNNCEKQKMFLLNGLLKLT